MKNLLKPAILWLFIGFIIPVFGGFFIYQSIYIFIFSVFQMFKLIACTLKPDQLIKPCPIFKGGLSGGSCLFDTPRVCQSV